jgi:NDP-hexose-3-ketoreductase
MKSCRETGQGARLRIGILGCSDIARRKFIPALLRSEQATLAAIASRDRQKAAELLPGVAPVLGYEELLAATGIDLVYLSLPNHLHEEWAVRALASGKHVICEKPLGLDAAAVERMVAVAEQRQLLLYENLMFLHHPQHALVKELLARGEIGRLVSLRSVFGFPVPAADNFRRDPAQGGGAFHDLARYPLGTACYFLQGDDYRFRGVTVERDGLHLGMYGVARTDADEVFTFSIAFGQQYESYYEVIGERGKIRLDRAYTTPADYANTIRVTVGSEERSVRAPASDHFQLMIDAVSSLVLTGGDFTVPHQQARRLALLGETMKRGCAND